MKLFLILLLVSLNSFAGFVAGSKMNLCNRSDYSSPSICQEVEGEACYLSPVEVAGECGIYKLIDLYGTVKFDEETCEGQAACQSLLEGKICGVGRHALIDELYTEVYCVEVVGKEMVIDQTLKTQKDAEKAQAAAILFVKNKVKALRECLAGVIDLLVIRNASKNLNTAQVESMVQTYQPIMALLQAVSGATAKTKIQEVTADGVLVTEADKTALIAELDKCLGL